MYAPCVRVCCLPCGANKYCLHIQTVLGASLTKECVLHQHAVSRPSSCVFFCCTKPSVYATVFCGMLVVQLQATCVCSRRLQGPGPLHYQTLAGAEMPPALCGRCIHYRQHNHSGWTSVQLPHVCVLLCLHPLCVYVAPCNCAPRARVPTVQCQSRSVNFARPHTSLKECGC